MNLAAGGLIAAAAAAAPVPTVAAAGAVIAAAEPNDDQQNDDPAAVAAAPGILITHSATSYEIWSLTRLSFHGMHRVQNGSLAAGDAIAEGQQGVHKVNVLKEHAGNLSVQLYIGKVPETADAQIDQAISQRLGHISQAGGAEEKSGQSAAELYIRKNTGNPRISGVL